MRGKKKPAEVNFLFRREMERGAAGLMAGLTLPHSSGTRDSSQEHHDMDLVLAQAGAHQKHPQSTPDKAAFCSHSLHPAIFTVSLAAGWRLVPYGLSINLPTLLHSKYLYTKEL